MQSIYVVQSPDGKITGMYKKRETAERHTCKYWDGSESVVIEYRPYEPDKEGGSDA